MTSLAEIERLVRARASSRCEYCRMHQCLQGATFHVEHIQPRSRGGPFTLENLALACPGCNLHKSDRSEYQPVERAVSVPLFHPRQDTWAEHFAWDEYELIGLSETGLATIECLQLNHERRVRIRQAEGMFDLFPPDDAQDEGDESE